MKHTSRQAGIALLDILVSLAIVATLATLATATIVQLSHRATDESTIVRANEEAHSTLVLLADTIHSAGAGLPIGQRKFQSGTVGLGDAPLPILTTSSEKKITLRTMASGTQTTVLEDYTPSIAALTIKVDSETPFKPGDLIYLNNLTTGGEEGLKGIVRSTIQNKITIGRNFITPVNAAFPSGSLASLVDEISLENHSDGIVRIDKFGDLILAPNSSFELQYLDSNNNILKPPLSAREIQNNLSAVRITVGTTPSRPLKLSETKPVQSEQTVSLQNLILSRRYN